MKKYWNDEERQRMRELAKTLTTEEIANRLGRSYNSVNAELSGQGIRVRRSDGILPWTTKMVETATEMALRKVPVPEIAKAVGRNERSVYRAMERRGVELWEATWWTAEDERYLRESGPSQTAKQISAAISRTANSVRYKASQLGVTLVCDRNTRPKVQKPVKVRDESIAVIPRWSLADEDLLRELAPSTPISELAARLSRSERSIERKAGTMAVKLMRRPMKPRKSRTPKPQSPQTVRAPRPRGPEVCRLAWCGVCSAPVVNTYSGWAGHYERVGCNRTARPRGFMEGLRA